LSKHDVHEDKKWEIVLGGWEGTRSVIRNKNQTPKDGLVKVEHSESDFNTWKENGISIMVQDGLISVAVLTDKNQPEYWTRLFKYEDPAIVKDELRFVLISGGFGGSGTIENIQPISSWQFEGDGNCWHDCNQQGGQCDACNQGSVIGYCCRPDGAAGNGDCPDKEILNLSPHKNKHQCFYKL